MKTITTKSISASTRTKLFTMTVLLAAILYAVPSANALTPDTELTAKSALRGLAGQGIKLCDDYYHGALRPGQSIMITRTFNRGLSYALFAAGCEGAYGIHIEIYDSNWDLVTVGKDVAISTGYTVRGHSGAVVRPFVTDVYHIKVTMGKCASAGAEYVLCYGWE